MIYDANSQLFKLHHDHKCDPNSYINNETIRLTPTPSRCKNYKLPPKPMVRDSTGVVALVDPSSV